MAVRGTRLKKMGIEGLQFYKFNSFYNFNTFLQTAGSVLASLAL